MYAYYTSGALLGTVVVDLVVTRWRLPWATATAALLLYAARFTHALIPFSLHQLGILRLVFAIGVPVMVLGIPGWWVARRPGRHARGEVADGQTGGADHPPLAGAAPVHPSGPFPVRAASTYPGHPSGPLPVRQASTYPGHPSGPLPVRQATTYPGLPPPSRPPGLPPPAADHPAYPRKRGSRPQVSGLGPAGSQRGPQRGPAHVRPGGVARRAAWPAAGDVQPVAVHDPAGGVDHGGELLAGDRGTGRVRGQPSQDGHPGIGRPGLRRRVAHELRVRAGAPLRLCA